MLRVASMAEGVPKVFLRYDAPVPKAPDAPLLSPVFEQQTRILLDAPIVTTTDKVLDAVLPPREFVTADGVRMAQRVDHQQVSREQLSDLHTMFEFKLKDAKARTSGICPVRQAIYSMLFDELVRQVVIDNPERGLMLARLRDEMRMTTDAYVTLYDASVAYSARKLHDATHNVPEMRERMASLRGETDVLKKELSRLQAKHAAMLRCVEQQQQADRKKHHEEKKFLADTQARLEKHLAAVKEAQDRERRQLRGEDDEPHA